MATGTIETHLSKYISSGDIKITTLVSNEKITAIESALKRFDGKSITPIKQQVGNDISFGEIKLVMASLGIKQERSSD